MSASLRSKSTSLPGVPVARCARAAATLSALSAVPPTNAWQLMPRRCVPMMRHTSQHCRAISRVGTTMSACGAGWLGRMSSSASAAKTTVFPVPDLACAIMSTPMRPIGIARAWMADGRSNPASARPRRIGSDSRISENSIASSPNATISVASLTGLARRGRVAEPNAAMSDV